MEHGVYMQTAVWLVSRNLTESAGPWNTQLSVDDDGEYFCRVLIASSGTLFVPKAKVYYRRQGSSSLSYVGRSNRKMEDLFLSVKLHIGYVRSLEDNTRVRAACLKFLQYSLFFFYPERPDIVEKVRELAAELGGQLSVPGLSWKYVWIQRVFGWPIVKRTKIILPQCKWALIRSLD